MKPRPTHVGDEHADRTRCGIRLHSKRHDPTPYMGAHAVDAHIAGRARAGVPPVTWCQTCRPDAAIADLTQLELFT